MAEIAIETAIENKNKMDDYYPPKPKFKPTPKPKLSLPVAATATEKAIAIAAATATETETAIEKIKNKTVDYPPKLTLPEKRKLALTLVYLTGSAGYHSIAGLFRGKKGARYYFIHVAHAIIREALRSMTCREWQYVWEVLPFPVPLPFNLSSILLAFAGLDSGDFSQTNLLLLQISDSAHVLYLSTNVCINQVSQISHLDDASQLRIVRERKAFPAPGRPSGTVRGHGLLDWRQESQECDCLFSRLAPPLF